METEKKSTTYKFHHCLCGRDPSDTDVCNEIAWVMAFRLHYGLVQDGCLSDAAAVLGKIYAHLDPDKAREIEQIMGRVRETLHRSVQETTPTGGPWLH